MGEFFLNYKAFCSKKLYGFACALCVCNQCYFWVGDNFFFPLSKKSNQNL